MILKEKNLQRIKDVFQDMIDNQDYANEIWYKENPDDRLEFEVVIKLISRLIFKIKLIDK
tara:strand:+ start:118 stop:297 length:180 start_codon:yes stop_codon:yes gene_type:complete